MRESRPMRITIVTGPWHSMPPAPCGAVERLWHGLANEFAQLGHDVVCICRSYKSLASYEKPRDNLTFIRRTRLSATGKLSRDILKDLWYTTRVIPVLPRADILVTNNVWMPAVCPRLSSRWGKVVQNVNRMPKGQMKYYLRCARLSAVSKSVAERIVTQCPAAQAITTVIPNPIDTTVFSPNFGVVKAHSPDAPYLLYAGRLNQEKGIETLINAFRLVSPDLPTLRLRIVGPVSIQGGGSGSDYLSKLRSLAAGLRVDFQDAVWDRKQLADLFRNASVFVYPSIAAEGEALPVAPLEALACGVPVIVSALPQFSDYLEDNVTGLVFNHLDPQPELALATCLHKVLSDSHLSDRLTQAGALVGARFGYPEVAKQYLADWQTLVAP